MVDYQEKGDFFHTGSWLHSNPWTADIYNFV